MTNIIGTAPDSWGVWYPNDAKQPPWQQYLDEVGAAGYGWTELGPFGYLPTDIKILRAELDRRGLLLCGATVGLPLADPGVRPALDREVAAVSARAQAMGARYLILYDDDPAEEVAAREGRRLGDAAWVRLIDNTHHAARRTRDGFGLRLTFHPHAGGRVEHEDEIERFLADTDPTLVGLCLDTGHHAYCGGDVLRFMEAHHDRIDYLHFKNVDAVACARAQEQGTSFADAVAEGAMRCLDDGMVDFAAVKRLVDAKGLDVPIVVEQDMYPAPFDKPLPIAKRNREVLRTLGFG